MMDRKTPFARKARPARTIAIDSRLPPERVIAKATFQWPGGHLRTGVSAEASEPTLHTQMVDSARLSASPALGDVNCR
jgi:hypothetical protein